MSRNLSDLCYCIRPQVEKLLREAHQKFGWSMVVVDTVRTPEEQRENLAKKVSWTLRSNHLPQPSCNKSHAADIAPYHLMQLKNWGPEHPDWELLGELGESFGLLWGGRWKQRDCPHFEVKVEHDLVRMAGVQSDVTMAHFGES